MKLLFTALFFAISTYFSAQQKRELSVTEDKENIVSSALLGEWRAKHSASESFFSFENEPKVLPLIAGTYYDHFRDLIIYQAGNMKYTRGSKTRTCPYILTQIHGNPVVFFFLERNGNPVGNGESFFLFVAIGENRNKDRLFIGGDFNNQPFYEYVREK